MIFFIFFINLFLWVFCQTCNEISSELLVDVSADSVEAWIFLFISFFWSFVYSFYTCDKGKMQMATNLEVSTMNIFTYENHWSCDLKQYHNYLLDLFTIYQMSDVKTDVDQEKKEVRFKIYQCIKVTAILFGLSQMTFFIHKLKVSMPFCT